MLIDTHCHLFSEYYSFEEIDDIVSRCRNEGIQMIIVNGCDRKSNEEVLSLVEEYDIVYGALGLQPTEINDDYLDDILFIDEHIDDEKILAVGEIGLDYHYDCDKNMQLEAFRKQLEIAKCHNKPVIIHSRDSVEDVYNTVLEYGVVGIIHCYNDTVLMARKFNEIGFMIGIGGLCTFKNASRVREVIKSVPLEYIVLETDSPYLTPVPYRGRRNEPFYVMIVAKMISEVKNLDFSDVCETTTCNVMRLFDK